MKTEIEVPAEDCFVDVGGVQQIAPLSKPTIRTAEREGELPGYRVRGRLLFRRSDVLEWIERGRTAPRRIPPPELLAAGGRPPKRARR